tara:strand:- start:289 stop:1101 length:813 start_codon:yes stop_codon:yes gene_type:complete
MILLQDPKEVDLKQYFLNLGLTNLVYESEKSSNNDPNILVQENAYRPELDDLYTLYNLIIKNKRTTVLEFGVGWSSLIFALALDENRRKYKNEIESLRRNNPFELHSIDNENEFISIAKNRIPSKLLDSCYFYHSNVSMTSFQGRYATEFERLPLISPDFIYLDGPDQFNIKKDINGFTTAHKDMMPMSCDLLKIEHYLTPGTMIVVDGRSANARFLLTNFQRNWDYQYTDNDQHIFYLDENPLGEINQRQLNFYFDEDSYKIIRGINEI